MQITRRTILKAGTAAGACAAFGLSSTPVWSQTSTMLGETRIDVVSDGHLTLPGSFLFDAMPEDELAAILARYEIDFDSVTPACNLTLMRDGERTVLFDAGSGPNFQQTAGQIAEALAAIEVDPSDVTHVVFTHAHPDHLWGVLDEFDDPLFAEATHMIGKTEWDYWTDPETVATISEARQAFAVGAKRNLLAIEDTIERFDGGQEILPGVMARPTFGHTPGHMAFEIAGGGERVMVVGDAIVNHHVAFERPQWEAGSDQDRAQAAKTRVDLLDQLASEKTRLIGFHLPYPGIGYAEKKGTAYRFVPA